MNISELYSTFQKHPYICTDSRLITKDSLFFALKGDNFNGNKFAEQAINMGCAYAIVDQKQYANHSKTILVDDVLQTLQGLAKYHREQLSIPIIGITGTNGKTTSKELIHTVLQSEMNCFATKENLNNHIGVPISILNINNNHEVAIIEMGANHQHEIEFLCAIAQPTHGVITNIGSAHLEGFVDLKGVINAKNELYQFIENSNGYIFVNHEDKKLIKLSEKINQTTYGEFGDVKATVASKTPYLNIYYNDVLIKSKLIGSYQFDNILLAVCIGEYFNISLNNIKTAVEDYSPINNRSQIIKTKSNTLILDAYNANPSSMSAMLYSFAEQTYENKICILGDMLELGEYSEKEHYKIISLCKKLHLDTIFIGEDFKKLKENTFQNREIFEEHLVINPITNKTILLKGSRGIRLEKLVELL